MKGQAQSDWVGPTDHAVDRLGLFYPGADGKTVIDEVGRGVLLEPETAAALVGARARPGYRYVLHRERTGVFVLTADRIVVTFLRFSTFQQHELARRLWPGGDPVSTDLPLWTRGMDEPESVEDRLGVYATAGVLAKTGRTLAEIGALVRVALADGALEAADGRQYSTNRPYAGVLRLGEALIGVLVERDSIRLQLVHPSKAERAAKRKEERRQAGLRQAADLLRANGWTVIPPTSDESSGRGDVR